MMESHTDLGDRRRTRSRLGFAALACAIAAPLALAACNTTKGVGKDVEAAGEGIQDIADDTKDAIRK